MKYKEFNHRWISDGIGDEYKAWGTLRRQRYPLRIFVESATGTGKTSFVLRKFAPYVLGRGENILYLGNRIALITQIEEEIKKSFRTVDVRERCKDKKKNGVIYDIWNNEYQAWSNITVVNYQAFQGFITRYMIDLQSYSYVLFDEAHYFLEDAPFNALTGRILVTLSQNVGQAVFIFLSATLSESEEVLKAAAWLARPKHENQQMFDQIYKVKKDILLYRNTYVRLQYNFHLYTKNDEILNMIEKSPKSEKWLLFSDSILEGNKLSNYISEKMHRSVAFFDAKKKSLKAWERLVKGERSRENVLIVTKVFDNGANIHDSMVKHIVLPFCERTDFLQMLGRRRVDNGEQIEVYIRVPSAQTINSQLNQTNRKIETVANAQAILQEDYYKGNGGLETRLLQDLWLKGDRTINSLFYIDENRRVVPNVLAYEKLSHRRSFLCDLKDNFQDVHHYLDIVSSWITRGARNQTIRFSTVNGRYTIDELLRGADSVKIDRDGELFYQEFQLLYKMWCGEHLASNKEMLDKALNVRKGKTQRKATMNRELKIAGLPYHIIKRTNEGTSCWIIQQHGGK